MGFLILAAIIAISGYGQEVLSVFVSPTKPKTWAEQYADRMIREGKWSNQNG